MPDDQDALNERRLQARNLSTELVLETRNIGAAATETVDARRLHAFLEVRSEFRNWIKNRITDFGFEEGSDFTTTVKNYRGGERRDYYVTLDMAKELSMVERNAKGKQARQYFIACEKRAQAKARHVSPAARTDVGREYRLMMQANVRWARMAGLTGNQALLAANQATTALTGIDTLGLLGVPRLTAPQNEALLTPSDIGKRLDNISARAVNLLLCEQGLQDAFRDAKGHVYYEATEDGIAAGGVMQDTGKRHSSGTPVRQLRWASSVIDLLGRQGQLV